jgi:hypothetical protein
MTKIEKRLLAALEINGQAPSRIKLCQDAGVSYQAGYYAIQILALRGLIELSQANSGRACQIKFVKKELPDEQ